MYCTLTSLYIAYGMLGLGQRMVCVLHAPLCVCVLGEVVSQQDES